MATMTQLLKYLWANGIKFRVIGRAPAFLRRSSFEALGEPLSNRARTVLIKAGQDYWMAVVPTGSGIDMHALSRAVNKETVQLATEEDLTSLMPGCETATLPPIGNLFGFPVVIDKSLADEEKIVFNACSTTDSIVMSFEDYSRLVQPTIAQIAEGTDEQHTPYERGTNENHATMHHM